MASEDATNPDCCWLGSGGGGKGGQGALPTDNKLQPPPWR